MVINASSVPKVCAAGFRKEISISGRINFSLGVLLFKTGTHCVKEQCVRSEHAEYAIKKSKIKSNTVNGS